MTSTLAPRAIWLATLAVVALTVAAVPAALPPTPGAFVWHDLVTDQPDASRAFYSALFGWTFEPARGVDPGYTIIKHQGVPIGGVVVRRGEGEGAEWLSYAVVADVDRAVDAFRTAGGRVFRGPVNARADLRVAAVADAQGAPIGLASHGPEQRDTGAVPPLHRWLWMDYVARDPVAALDFYQRVFGFTGEVAEQRDGFTYYLLSTDRARAGLFASPWDRETSAWLPYVRVESAAATAARAVELGGRLVLAPSPRARNGSLAIVLDPAGAPLALQQYPFAAGVTP
jgi:uncharacterized protein